MKFYEVQRALETGKKITRKTFNGKNLVKSPLMSIATFENSFAEYKFSYIDIIIADDWEIIEDIPEVQIQIDINELFTCQRCGSEQEFWPSMREKETFACCRCGQKHKMKNKLIDISDRTIVSHYGDGSYKVFLKE